MGINQEYGYWQIIDYKFKKDIDKLPMQCKKKYAVFKYVASFSGLSGVTKCPGFKLEKLEGKLKDMYSIRLNVAYRAVFNVDEICKVIEIKEISKHRYN